MPNTASALLNRLLARGKFRHVQVLLQLAELGSVQRTADAIGMTQSSVTQTLAYLENLLEVRLFDRHARGVRPTAACAELLPVARELMLGFASGAEIVSARRLQGEGVVRMIGSGAAVSGVLLDALPLFSDRFPGVQVLLDEAEGNEQLLAIARGKVDLVVCRRPAVIPEGWEFHPLREDRFGVLASAQHPLARSRQLRWEDLAEETWIVLPTGMRVRASFDELVAQFPHPPPTHPVVTRSLPMLWRLLLQRRLLAFLALNLARPLLDRGELVQLRVPPTPAIEPIGLLQPQANLGSAATRMSEFLRKEAASPPRRAASKRA